MEKLIKACPDVDSLNLLLTLTDAWKETPRILEQVFTRVLALAAQTVGQVHSFGTPEFQALAFPPDDASFPLDDASFPPDDEM
jgi:hypothetical protein